MPKSNSGCKILTPKDTYLNKPNLGVFNISFLATQTFISFIILLPCTR